jgi:hypothetical protein
MTVHQGVHVLESVLGLRWGGVYWFATFGLLVLPSYPFYKFHPTPSPNITKRVNAYQENQKGCHTSVGTRCGLRSAAKEAHAAVPVLVCIFLFIRLNTGFMPKSVEF